MSSLAVLPAQGAAMSSRTLAPAIPRVRPLRTASHPAGEAKLVVVANRLPVQRVAGRWDRSPGGLVSALSPVLTTRGGAWVGWSGTSMTPRPFDHDGFSLHPVAVSHEEKTAYYEGFANATLWPLYHDAVRPPVYRSEWWDAYVAVNRRFARAAAEAAASHGTVWVHDYQLQLVPAMLREMRPDLRIGFFLHIPFPPQELFMQLPWRQQILDGMLGADVVGFQVPVAAQNFTALARHLLGARGRGSALRHDGRIIRVGAFPISVDSARWEREAGDDEVTARMVDLRRRLGRPRTVLLGVDRLDYTKGIDLRLRAFGELLADGRLRAEDCVMVQAAVPSREAADHYGDQRDRVGQMVGALNGDFGHLGAPVVHYLHRGFPPAELAALYRVADVMLVTPLRDGMNLVAKEYVASRTDGTGVLVLSEFAGAARELNRALLVNPHDIEALKDAMVEAVSMPEKEQRMRMRQLRRTVKRHDVRHWADSFLGALEGAGGPG